MRCFLVFKNGKCVGKVASDVQRIIDKLLSDPNAREVSFEVYDSTMID